MNTSFAAYVRQRRLREGSDPVWNYVQWIAAHPSAEDLKTAGTMLVKSHPTNTYAWFADMWPAIQQIMRQLTPEEQQDVQQHFARLQHQDPEFERAVYRQGWRQFTSLPEFEEYLAKEMQISSPQPAILGEIIQRNQHLWDAMDMPFKQQVVRWMREQHRLQKSQQVNWAQIMRQQLSGTPIDPRKEQ